MRRAIVQGRRIGIEPGFLPRYAEVVRETMGAHYAELLEQADTVDMWLRTEEEAFNRTLESGPEDARRRDRRGDANGEEGIGADEAFKLHDTFGFPFDLTLELAAERGLGVDEQGFESLMEEQRVRARASAGREGGEDAREKLRTFATSRGRAVGLHRLRDDRAGDRGRAVVVEDGRVLAKLVESPFYATGGGQVHDGGVIECEDGGCTREGRRRRPAGRRPGARARAADGRAARRRARVRAGRPRRAARDRVQPHRDAPPARGAARAARHPRAPGGLLRRPGQAALRLHPRRAAERRGPPLGRGPRQRDDPRQPARARADDDARRGASARRDGAVRREVRRRRADGRGRRRRLVARAVRRHARALDGRDRRLQAHAGDLERRERAPDRGRSPARWASSCCAGTTACCTTRRSRCAPSRTRSPRSRRRRSRSAASSRSSSSPGAAAAVDAKPAEIVDIDGVRAVFEIREVAEPEGAAGPGGPAQERARRSRRWSCSARPARAARRCWSR